MMWRDAAVDDILARAMVARIATISRNGRPHVNPLYFVVEHDHVHLGTATYTLAAHNARANPAVQVLFEIESATAEAAHWLLPASAHAESEGTFVNAEGRAQRFFPAVDAAPPRRESWRWLAMPAKWRWP